MTRFFLSLKIKKVLFTFFSLLVMALPLLRAQDQIKGAMQSIFASPVVEDGKRNIILQNRCGNRLTLLLYCTRTDLEFTYKPNGYRRKEIEARNFSNRDNFTLLFDSVYLPMVDASNVIGFNYDPFITKLSVKNQWEAKNELSFLNYANENLFVLAAKAPLVIAVKPHKAFKVSNGLLTEKFIDRGEEIVSFVAFSNSNTNRFRVLKDGTYIIQVFENEKVIFGGEENEYQVNRVLESIKDKSFSQLVLQNERLLAPKMNQGVVHFSNPDFQKVLDINHRIVYSGIDEGGACFGALNRIYYLIWVRDGSMTSSLMARAGNPELIRIWTKFLLNNPSVIQKNDSTKVSEFLQIVGSRWTRNEDDGIFYATLSLFSYFKTTGQDDLLHGPEFPILLNAIDRYLKRTWDSEKKLMVSNTVGETPLKADPYFGYDVVNGSYEHNDFHKSQGKELSLNASLYNQVNTYNIMMMASDLLSQNPQLDKGRKQNYLNIAQEIKESISAKYYDKPNDCLLSSIEYYTDGTEGKLSFSTDDNPWEGSWANAIGPYFPAPDLQLKTVRFIYKTWPKITKQGYGYCPWNTLSKVLTEYGMPSEEYETMLSAEVKDALTLSAKYPMPGGLTEYNRQIESWRALPFSAGSLFFSMGAQMIASVPEGIAIRASNKVDSIRNFRYKLSTLNANASGNGDIVRYYILNSDTIFSSLQIPENKLLPGMNTIQVFRGNDSENFRLFSSTAQLLNMKESKSLAEYQFRTNVPWQLQFEQIGKAIKISVTDSKSKSINFTRTNINNGKQALLEGIQTGVFVVRIEL